MPSLPEHSDDEFYVRRTEDEQPTTYTLLPDTYEEWMVYMQEQLPEPLLAPLHNDTADDTWPLHHAPPVLTYSSWTPTVETSLGKPEKMSYMEVELPWYMARLWHDITDDVQRDEVLILQSTIHNTTTTVIKRDLHNITPAEAKLHPEAVRDGMHAEVKQWIDLKSMRRQKLHLADNLVDGRWVLKWKVVGNERTVKARLTLRGFKDRQTDVATFSATATRQGSRGVNCFAASEKLDLWSLDVSGAFLKGLTFAEIKEITGTLRSVQLMVDAPTAEVLRTFPGWENFDPQTECLDMLRPMWGLRDAPRLFTLRFSAVLRDTGHVPTQADSKTFLLHGTTTGDCNSMISGHLDDIKGASTKAVREAVVTKLESVVGKCKVSLDKFTFLGLQHEQRDNYEIYTHQKD